MVVGTVAFVHRAMASTALYTWAVVLAITLGVAFRLLLISNGWPVTNSDEANVGLQAIHILNRGELPIFVYGDDYNGSLEAYVGAFFFKLFEPSVFALRVGLVLMYGAFLATVYALGRSLYSRGVALAGVCLLCGGTSALRAAANRSSNRAAALRGNVAAAGRLACTLARCCRCGA